MRVPTIFIRLTLGVTALVSALPADMSPAVNTTLLADPSETYKYHGNALLEVWIGRAAVNIGDLLEGDLYDRLWKGIDAQCPHDVKWCTNSMGSGTNIGTHYVKQPLKFPWPHEAGGSYTRFAVTGRWEDEQIRRLLITAAASTISRFTDSALGMENCYFVNAPGVGKKFCNIPDFVRINLPDIRGSVNHMWVDIQGDQVYSKLRCCDTRGYQDKGLDGIGAELGRVFNKEWSKEVRCLVDGMQTCEDCGQKCNECGAKC